MRKLLMAFFVAAGCGTTDRVELAGLGGVLARSDGNSSFAQRDVGSSVDLWSLTYRDRDGWLVGNRGVILHSEDGGRSWAAQQSGTTADLRQVAFRDAQHGIAIGEFGSILSTTTGGNAWISTPAEGKEEPSAATANGSSWWVASALGGLFRSSDDAHTFVKQNVPNGVFRAIAFAEDALTGFAVGDAGTVIGTVDGGETWTQRDTAPGALRAVALRADASEVVAVGEAGLVWRSADGGAHFHRAANASDAALYGVAFAGDDASLYVVGERGTILRAAPRTEAFTAMEGPSGATWTSVVGLGASGP